MQLSDAEMKLIQRFRTKRHDWRRIRWVVVILSLLVFAGSLFTFIRIWDTVGPDQILILLCLIVAPAAGIVLAASIGGMMYALVFWNGCPVRKLVLKLAG